MIAKVNYPWKNTFSNRKRFHSRNAFFIKLNVSFKAKIVAKNTNKLNLGRDFGQYYGQ